VRPKRPLGEHLLFATVGGTPKVRATPGARASCPFCARFMIAKCGEINVWHWAHEVSFTTTFEPV
jgi:competence CoiA-like predicted nuclease